MGYPLLRLTSALLQICAVLLAAFLVVLFVSNVDYLLKINRELEQLTGSGLAAVQQLSALTALMGVSTPMEMPMLARTSERIIFDQLFQLFVGLVGCLALFGFGGLIGVVIDIRAGEQRRAYEAASDTDHDFAPVAPKPWASFPPSSTIPAPPSRARAKEERPRPRSKWDMGS